MQSHGMNRQIIIALAALAAAAPAAAMQTYSEGYTFLKAVRERDGATVQRIVSNPASTAVNSRDTSTGEGALHVIVRGRDLTWLSFLLGHGARPDSPSNDGTTPLIVAAQIGWSEGAAQLIARGANVNLGNSRGETPLIFAVQRRDVAMVRLLLAQRADPTQIDRPARMSAIDYARRDPRAAPILRELELRQRR